MYSARPRRQNGGPLQVPRIPRQNSSEKRPLLALTNTNLAAQNAALENARSISTTVKDHRERVRDAAQSLGFELSEQFLPGQHEGKGPMERWLDS